MTGDGPRVGVTAAALRSLFDASFTVPAISKQERLEGLLAIRVGSDPYVLCLSQITGLYADRRIVAVPSPAPQLLGIVGLRGKLVPVYDLAALLHYPPAPSPRWMVLAGGSQPVAFAFESFEGHVQVARALLANGGNVQVAGALRPIVDIASMVDTMRSNHS